MRTRPLTKIFHVHHRKIDIWCWERYMWQWRIIVPGLHYWQDDKKIINNKNWRIVELVHGHAMNTEALTTKHLRIVQSFSSAKVVEVWQQPRVTSLVKVLLPEIASGTMKATRFFFRLVEGIMCFGTGCNLEQETRPEGFNSREIWSYGLRVQFKRKWLLHVTWHQDDSPKNWSLFLCVIRWNVIG